MYVYILKCSDDSFYTGVAADMEKRLSQHLGLTKGGAKYTTRLRKVSKLAALWDDKSGRYARKLEYRLKKKLTHKDKERLCQNPELPFSEFGIDIPKEEFVTVDVDQINKKFGIG